MYLAAAEVKLLQVRENVRGYTVEGLARESKKGQEVQAICSMDVMSAAAQGNLPCLILCTAIGTERSHIALKSATSAAS